MHDKINEQYPNLRVLEISTKSSVPLGINLSAFNLKFYDTENQMHCIENVFQSSKVFSNGGPYRDLLNCSPRDAKRDERLKTSGELECFDFESVVFQLEPKSNFYDWIYVNALCQNPKLSDELINNGYTAFTDIEFNHKKSVNCQARAVAIFVSLFYANNLAVVKSQETFIEAVYSTKIEPYHQLQFC
jgi:type I restriction enzyme M protein